MGNADKFGIRGPHAKPRKGLIGQAALQVARHQPAHIVFHQRRGHPAQYRFSDRGILAQAAAQDDIEGFQGLAVGSAPRRPLQTDITGPMLGAGVGTAVKVELESRDLIAEIAD